MLSHRVLHHVPCITFHHAALCMSSKAAWLLLSSFIDTSNKNCSMCCLSTLAHPRAATLHSNWSPLSLQDIAVVPFLVLLPFVETNDLGGQSTMSLVYELGPTALKTLGSLAALLVVGRLVMRRLFELVAESRSDETFISLCLLTVTGAGLLTQKLGLSDTLGMFSFWCTILLHALLVPGVDVSIKKLLLM